MTSAYTRPWESAAGAGTAGHGQWKRAYRRKRTSLLTQESTGIFLKAAWIPERSRRKGNLGGQISHLAAIPPCSITPQAWDLESGRYEIGPSLPMT